MANWLGRYPVCTGFVLMFALTWPIDVWAAADSRGWTAVSPPPVLVVLVGYGFVVAALVATGFLDGRAGIRALLRRFLVWRVDPRWYAVVLIGPAVLVLVTLALHVISVALPPTSVSRSPGRSSATTRSASGRCFRSSSPSAC
jgi:hypothetical protein